MGAGDGGGREKGSGEGAGGRREEGPLAPAMIGVAVAATSLVAIGKFAICVYATSLGRSKTVDGVSSVEKLMVRC